MFNLFTKSSKLKEEIEDLKNRLEECKGKLEEKQEHINKTNAYWKKKMFEAKNGDTKSRNKKS
jgi:peptidoglycan hydrolase CwlO-like protein